MRRLAFHRGGNVGLTIRLDEFAESMRGDFDAYIYGQNSRVDRHESTTDGTSVRTISAPSGIVDFQPDEMTVRCGAGTTLSELQQTVGERGQYVNLPTSRRLGHSGRGTVGGALAAGESTVLRLGRGPIRDTLLQVTCADHEGRLITAGGPTVKNVSGFDLCRLHVGTFGVFGFMGEMILRTRPIPAATRWYSAEVSSPDIVTAIQRALYRPSSILWNGATVYICLEGHPLDIDDTVTSVGRSVVVMHQSDQPDLSPYPARWSATPTAALDLAASEPGRRIVEIGVGVVHDVGAAPGPQVDASSRAITSRLLDEFNPQRRLNRHLVDRVH